MRPRTSDRLEQRVDVLRDVVVTRPLPEFVHAVFVVGERFARDFADVGSGHDDHDAAGDAGVNGRGSASRARVRSAAAPPGNRTPRIRGLIRSPVVVFAALRHRGSHRVSWLAASGLAIPRQARAPGGWSRPGSRFRGRCGRRVAGRGSLRGRSPALAGAASGPRRARLSD